MLGIMHHLLQDMVTAEEDYLQRGDLSSLSVLSQPAHSIVVVDAPDSGSSNGVISGSFDAEQCWSMSNPQQQAWMNVLRKRSRHHTCSQRCKFARRSGSKKLSTSEEMFVDDARPHVVVIDDLSSSSGDGHFQRKSSRIWGKRSTQRSGHPGGSNAKTKRGRAQDRLQKQQLSLPHSPLNVIPKMQPFSITIKKMSRKDILHAMSNSGSSDPEGISLKATRKKARVQTARSRHRKKQANGDNVREMAPAVAGKGVQKQHTDQTTPRVPSLFHNFSSDDLINGTRHSGRDPIGGEMSYETSPKKSVSNHLISPFSPEDFVPVQGLHKNCAGVIDDTIEELPSKMDAYTDAPSTFSLEDFVPMRGMHKKHTGVIDDTIEEIPSKMDAFPDTPSTFSPEDFVPMRGLRTKRTQVIDSTLEEMPHEMTTSDPSVDPVCPRSQRHALSLEEEELLEVNVGNIDDDQAHQSTDQLPNKRTNIASVKFRPVANATDSPCKRKKVLLDTCVVLN